MDFRLLSSSKKMVKDSLVGGGAIVGKNVTVSSIEPIEGGNKVTFAYVLDTGERRESYLNVMNGEDAISPTITENRNNSNDVYKLNITTKDRTFTTPNLIPSLDLSKIVVDISLNNNLLSVTKGDGSVKYITLPTVVSGEITLPPIVEEENKGNSGATVDAFKVSSFEFNASDELEATYSGEPTQEFPEFEVNYSSGELTVNGNGNNGLTFSENNKDLEVTY